MVDIIEQIKKSRDRLLHKNNLVGQNMRKNEKNKIALFTYK